MNTNLRRTPTTGVALALCLGAGLAIAPTRDAHAAGVSLDPAVGPAVLHANADLPIRRVTMYRSGVAAFERSGTVEGDATLRMLFDAQALDDVLKSLVILDGQGGRVTSVNYTVAEPLARRLAALGLDSGDLSVDGLLRALRGVTINYTTFGEPNQPMTAATVLGVSARTIPTQQGDSDITFVSLLENGRIRSIPVNALGEFEIADLTLRDEFAGVLTELNRQRAELQRAIDVSLSGEGRRRVAARYVAPAPVWKTSYRLVLGESSDADQDATLVGFAIVENTSDQDWEGVRLSLVSGRPVGFTMALSAPVFAPRQSLPVPIELAIAGPTFERGLAAVASELSPRADSRARGGGAFDRQAFADSAESGVVFSMSNSAAALAQGADAGDFFAYTVDTPVDVKRQSSAMIPIINAEIDAQRVTIYNAHTANAPIPMRGVRLTNGAELELLAGPITVYDASAPAGSYQGDARIDRVGRGDERLIAYAQDLDLSVNKRASSPTRREDVRVQDGVLRIRTYRWNDMTYAITNDDERAGRTVVVSHPKLNGYELVSRAKPRETTPSNTYRFDVEVDASGTATLEVSQRRLVSETLALSSFNDATIRRYTTDRNVPQSVRDVFTEYAKRRAQIATAKADLAQLEAERDRIGSDQERIRGNMAALDRQSDLYRRYLQTLSTGEDRLEALRGEIESAAAQVATLERSLNQWLRSVDAE